MKSDASEFNLSMKMRSLGISCQNAQKTNGPNEISCDDSHTDMGLIAKQKMFVFDNAKLNGKKTHTIAHNGLKMMKNVQRKKLVAKNAVEARKSTFN